MVEVAAGVLVDQEQTASLLGAFDELIDSVGVLKYFCRAVRHLDSICVWYAYYKLFLKYAVLTMLQPSCVDITFLFCLNCTDLIKFCLLVLCVGCRANFETQLQA